jgi:hypothetical protein
MWKLVFAFVDSVLGALRTAGALLIGNSILVYFGVIGAKHAAFPILAIGILVVLVSSIPWTTMSVGNLFRGKQ